MRNLILFLIISSIFYITLRGQSPIVPYTLLGFESINPIWQNISEDSTIADNIKYDGRHHFFAFHNRLVPIEKGGYVYTCDMGGLYGLEGGILQKRDTKSGKLMWKQVFDRRTYDYHEWPQKILYSKDNTIDVLSYKTLKSYKNTEYIFFLNQVPVSWSVRKYNMDNGELISHIYIKDTTYHFNSGANLDHFFEVDSGYVQAERSETETDEYYAIHKFDNNLEHISSDTTYLNLPTVLNDILIGGFLPYNDGYISLDVKLGFDKPRHYSLLFWDKNFEVRDLIKPATLEALFADNPSRFFLRYVNDEIIILQTYKHNGNQYVPTGYMLNHKGEMIQKINNPIINNTYIDAYTFYDERTKCPIQIAGYTQNGYFLEINNACDTNMFHLKIKTLPENLAVKPINAFILSNGNILISLQQSKDTTINNNERLYSQGIVWMVLDGKSIGLTSSTYQATNSRKLKLYPNPTSGQIQIENLDQNSLLRVLDLNGNNVKIFENVNFDINIDDIPSGIYIIEIKNNAIHERHKIVKIE